MEPNSLESKADNKIDESLAELGTCPEDDDLATEMCGAHPVGLSLSLTENESARLELIRKLDCGAISPFENEDELLPNENDYINQHLTEDIGLTSVQCALEMQRHMVELQMKQNDTITSVLEQQKETNKYLNEMVKDKQGNNNILGTHFEAQRNINSRLEELLTLFKAKVEIEVKS